MGRDETPITLAGRTIGVGLCVPALVLPAVRDGGFAPLAVAAATAVLVGVPAAQAEWRAARPLNPGWAEAAAGTARLAGILLVAAVAAPLVRGAGVGGVALCLAGWGGALALGSRARTAWWVALVLLAIAAGRAALGVALSPGATSVSPLWETWPEWLGPAILAGVLAGGVGLGPWSAGPRRVPGHDETPWAVAGASILFATLWAVQAGARFEATFGASFADLGRDALLGGAALLGAATVVGPRTAPGFGVRAVVGAVTTLWLAGPGLESVPLVLEGVVPCLAALLLVGTAWAIRSPAGGPPAGWSVLAPCVAAAAIVAAVVFGPPAMPTNVTAGAAGGVLLALAFWIIATRAVLAHRSARGSA